MEISIKEEKLAEIPLVSLDGDENDRKEKILPEEQLEAVESKIPIRANEFFIIF